MAPSSRPRRTVTLAAVLPLLLLASACGSEVRDDDGEVGGEITYWSMWQKDEPQAKVFQQAARDFEKKTGARVKIEWQGREVTQKLAPLLRSGDVPDVVDQAAGPLSATLGKSRQATDLGPVYDEPIPGTKTTVGKAGADKYRELSTVNDTTLMVPYQALAYGLWFDAAAHGELAERPPTTLDELSTYFDKRTADGRTPIAIDGDYGFARALWLNTTIMRHIGADGYRALAEDKSGDAWDRPEVRKAVQYVADLASDDHFLKGSFGTKWPAQQERFAGGEGDVLFMGSWLPQEVSGTADKDVEFRGLPLPEGPGEHGEVQTDVVGFAVPKASNNVATAKAFIAHTLQSTYQKQLADTAEAIPTRDDVKVGPALAPLAQAVRKKEPVALFGGTDNDHPTYKDEVIYPASLDLLSGKTTTAGFLKKVKSAQVAYWKKNR